MTADEEFWDYMPDWMPGRPGNGPMIPAWMQSLPMTANNSSASQSGMPANQPLLNLPRQAAPDFDSRGWLDPQSQAAQFFAQQYDPVRAIALKRNVDPSLLLGLSALETGWGKPGSNYSQRLDPWGATPKGDGTAGLSFKSFEDAWQAFDKAYGARIQDVGSDPQAFIDRLSTDNRGRPGTDGRGSFNSEKQKGWQDGVAGAIKGVQERLPYWRGNLDSYD